MSGLNKGEWNELYTLLYLLEKSNINIVDSDLQIIDSTIFKINKLMTQGETSLTYQKINNDIEIYQENIKIGMMSLDNIVKAKEILLNILIDKKILGGGSIELPIINKFCEDFTRGYSIKGKSKSKADIAANVKDNIMCKNVDVTYSVKSQLGSPATLLNSSKHTNFMYKIGNFDKEKMKKVNNINTKKKLLDRIHKIKELGGTIEFYKIVSSTLEKNVKLIDSSMDKLLANALLYSYVENEKDLQKAFFKANHEKDEKFLRKNRV